MKLFLFCLLWVLSPVRCSFADIVWGELERNGGFKFRALDPTFQNYLPVQSEEEKRVVCKFVSYDETLNQPAFFKVSLGFSKFPQDCNIRFSIVPYASSGDYALTPDLYHDNIILSNDLNSLNPVFNLPIEKSGSYCFNSAVNTEFVNLLHAPTIEIQNSHGRLPYHLYHQHWYYLYYVGISIIFVASLCSTFSVNFRERYGLTSTQVSIVYYTIVPKIILFSVIYIWSANLNNSDSTTLADLKLYISVIPIFEDWYRFWLKIFGIIFALGTSKPSRISKKVKCLVFISIVSTMGYSFSVRILDMRMNLLLYTMASMLMYTIMLCNLPILILFWTILFYKFFTRKISFLQVIKLIGFVYCMGRFNLQMPIIKEKEIDGEVYSLLFQNELTQQYLRETRSNLLLVCMIDYSLVLFFIVVDSYWPFFGTRTQSKDGSKEATGQYFWGKAFYYFKRCLNLVAKIERFFR
ncbi:hypothetical protein CAAN1_32S00364 [[Candida] anglica]|uniref:Uncharacterized protein n=1 Tax=[Candida] anglica TaxID=148631 RepID=A0ABP0EF31_9ASCO